MNEEKFDDIDRLKRRLKLIASKANNPIDMEVDYVPVDLLYEIAKIAEGSWEVGEANDKLVYK